MTTGAQAPEAPVDLPAKWLEELEVQQEQLRPHYEAFLQLEDIKERLTGKPAPARARTGTASAARATGGNGRVAQGQRKEQFLAVIQQHPEGITIPQIAELMEGDVKNNYLYRLRNQAEAANEIRREGDKLVPAKS